MEGESIYRIICYYLPLVGSEMGPFQGVSGIG